MMRTLARLCFCIFSYSSDTFQLIINTNYLEILSQDHLA